MKIKILYILFLLSYSSSIFAQNGVGINTNGLAPHSSAMLEIQSTDKGVLIPRLADISTISNPAIGLLVYNTTKNCFSYYIGANQWIDFPGKVISTLEDRDKDTKIYADKSGSDDDMLRFTSGLKSDTETEIATLSRTGLNLSDADASYKLSSNDVLKISLADTNIFAGIDAGKNITSGTENIFFGYNAGGGVATSGKNTFFGYNAGVNTTGESNVFIGSESATSITSGTENIAIGNKAMQNSTTTSRTIAIGSLAGNNVVADSNILIGNRAGANVVGGKNNIVIGNNNELNSNVSDTLIIGNATGSKISANLSTKKIWFNGYSFPGETGVEGEILKLDNNNNLEWSGRVPREVAGILTDMQPFNKGLTSTTTTLGGNIFYIKIISYASARVDSIKTFVANSTGGSSLLMGLYDENMQIMGQGSVALSATDGYYSIAINGDLGVNAESSKTYYLAIYTDDTTAEFLTIDDTYNQPAIESPGAITQLPAVVGGTVGAEVKSIWLHAF